MRSALFCALVVALGAGAIRAAPPEPVDGVLRDEELNYEIRLPPESIDWEFVELAEAEKKAGYACHLNTFWADSDPPAAADVYLWIKKLSKEGARMGLEFAGKRFRDVEKILENPRNRKEGKGKLGGADCWEVDVTGNHVTFGSVFRIQYKVALNGKYLYAIIVYQSYDAVDDEDLADELNQIFDNFKFLEIREVGAHKQGGAKAGDVPDAGAVGGGGGSKEAEIPPERLERRKIREDFWKFEAVKPQGLMLVPQDKHSDSEKANGMKLKLERRLGQTYCLIRVYAASLKSGQRVFTIRQLAERYKKSFEKTYKATMRKKPEIDKKWGLGSMSKKSLMLKLIGRRTVPETTYWYFADCKNGRQYQIQIYVTGATGEKAWKPQIDDFMANFKPFK